MFGIANLDDDDDEEEEDEGGMILMDNDDDDDDEEEVKKDSPKLPRVPAGKGTFLFSKQPSPPL